ncbi:MAG: AI-2E family transporter [Acidobacteria bacterium]|nr:AI-2E family transporter [Acidobacteriota bacterium]MBV9146476.1 AI-2E family transporter [Acidobacteriota bacterium]MBV9437152.1 AI-2E family transporter [Acidobacteriota bacterium]
MPSQPLRKDREQEQANERKAGPTPVSKRTGEEQAPEVVQNLEEGVQEVHEELRKATVTQIILTVLVVLAVCYFAKLVLVTIFTSVLIAFILEPIVRGQLKIHIPRGVGSAIAVLLMLGMFYGLTYFFYQRAVDFAHQLPRISGEIRKAAGKYQQSAESLKQSAQNVIPPSKDDKNAIPVKVQQTPGISGMLGPELTSLTETLLAVAFIPFLVYFMLTWQEHTRRATVRLFPVHSRLKAYQTLGKISDMMRAFIVGNFLIGLFMSAVSIGVFGFLHLPYFYFLGLISGFLSLIPYLGLVLAVIPPVASGIGIIHSTGILLICATILGLHVFSMNVLYPKVIGGRLELNPLAVTLGLFVWGWIWGAMGLILAVPVLGTIKIVCDNVEGLEPFGQWLGDQAVPKAVTH